MVLNKAAAKARGKKTCDVLRFQSQKLPSEETHNGNDSENFNVPSRPLLEDRGIVILDTQMSMDLFH